MSIVKGFCMAMDGVVCTVPTLVSLRATYSELDSVQALDGTGSSTGSGSTSGPRSLIELSTSILQIVFSHRLIVMRETLLHLYYYLSSLLRCSEA